MGGGLSSVPPGPGLGLRLAMIDMGALPDDRLLDFVHAQYRQLAFQQERLWAALAEVGRRAPLNLKHDASVNSDRLFDCAVAEISAELRISRLAAERELSYGLDLQETPRIAAALAAGELDRVKAVVLAEACGDLRPEHRAKVLDEVLPFAAAVRVSALKARVQRLAIGLDPGWAERRYRDAVREQKVVHYLAADGTVTICCDGLPADQAAAAMGRLTGLARAAKRAGANATTDRLRATLICGLIGPRFARQTEIQIIAELVAEFPKTDQTTGETTDPSIGDVADPPAAQPSGKPSPKPATLAPRVTEPATEPATESPADEPGEQSVRVVESGVELRVGLATLMRLVDEPGEVAGLGPVIAPVARAIAETQCRGEWRYAIVDEAGRLLHDGITRHRPDGYPAGGAKGGIVELHVPTHLLDPAFAAEHPAWAKLLRDLARQYAQQAPIVQDPAARVPGKPLRRRVQVRHRYCTFPGCRRPAADSQTDHRRNYANHGPTTDHNLGPACTYHHDLKTRWGWRLVKRDHTAYLWISPLGRKHVVPIEPIAPPLPKPDAQGRERPRSTRRDRGLKREQ